MKKTKIALSVAILALTAAFQVQAASTLEKLEVKQDVENGEAVARITVSGTSDEDYVTLTVINPDRQETEVDLNDGSTSEAVYQMLKNIKVQDNRFVYSYTKRDGSGDYTVKLGGDTYYFTLMSSDALVTFLEGINDPTADIDGLFREYSTELGLDALTGCRYDGNKLSTAISKEENFSKVSDAVVSYEKNALALILSHPDNQEKVMSLLQTYSETLALSQQNAFEIFDGFQTAQKKEVFRHLTDCEVEDYESFCNFFSQQVVLTALAHTQSYGDAETLLKDNQDIIAIDWDDVLDGVKGKSTIYKNLAGKYFDSEEALEKRAKEIVKTQKNKENNKNTGSGGGGGGGGNTIGSGSVFADGRMPSGTQITPAIPNIPAALPNSGQENIFSDLQGAEWAENAIMNLVEKKAISGMGDGIFAPSAEVTREQFVKVLVAAMGITEGEDPGFVDVDPEQWYYESVCVAYKNQIVMGVDAEHFGIGNTLTREQMAAFVYRAMLHCGYTFTKTSELEFTDAGAISGYAKEAVCAMNAEGIINGFPEGTFAPGGLCTRAQMAVVVAKACELLAN